MTFAAKLDAKPNGVCASEKPFEGGTIADRASVGKLAARCCGDSGKRAQKRTFETIGVPQKQSVFNSGTNAHSLNKEETHNV